MLRDNNKWDGIERRSIERRNYARDEVGYYVNDYPPQHHEQPQVIIEQPPIEQKDYKWVPSALAGILYPIVIGLGTFVWHANDRITGVEYKIQSSVDRQTQHEKDDIEFKNELKELNSKIDRLKEQLSSVDQTIMQMMSEAARNHRRGP